MRIVAKTDIGRVRDSNQDSYAAGELPGGVAWAVVCDGMGGAAGGNVASSTAVKMISQQITAQYRDGMSGNSIRNMLASAVAAANVSIFDLARSNPELHGMGTTVVAAILSDHMARVAHVGDSRAYKISAQGLLQMTRDHSVVQELVETGRLTPDEAKAHPRKNIITRALGVDETVDIDFCEDRMEPDDVLLLCTDGLTNYLETDEIFQIAKSSGYYESAQQMVDLANQHGGGDNITVVAITY
ncbi:MAG TPA: Stp1/IreP family PP2C-type Ser/Thr phosphatase [Candidatus Fimivicinus intestinavium]|nr:Stp1/IreP family PP2C-type Ser/Thr phosphatase [Candidatus Fimivicinus intestinavium]